MALVGYARVSSVGQSLDVQLDKLQHCDKIFQETDQRRVRPTALAPHVPGLCAGRRYPRRHPLGPAGTLDLASVSDRRRRLNASRWASTSSTSRSIRVMRPDGCCSICSAPLPSSKRRSAPSVRWMGFRKPRRGGSISVGKKRLTPAQVTELRHRRAQGDLIKTLMQDYGLSKASVYRYLGAHDASLGSTDHPSSMRRSASPGHGRAAADRRRRASTGEAEPSQRAGHAAQAESVCCRMPPHRQARLQPSEEPGDGMNAQIHRA